MLQISTAAAVDRLRLRTKLAGLRRAMNDHVSLYPALAYRGARSLELDQLHDIFRSRTDVVCVDWAVIHDRLFMVSVRPGEEPRISELRIKLEDVTSWMQINMHPVQLRQKTANLRFRKL